MPKQKPKQKPEEIVPIKHGTFGPESGPYGETVIDPEDSPLAVTPEPESKEDKAQAKLQAKAENEKAARKAKVVAQRRGYIGNRIIEPGTVFVLDLEKGQKLPTWVEATDDNAATTPLNHSAEALPQKIA